MTDSEEEKIISRKKFLKLLGAGGVILYLGGIGNLFNKRVFAQQISPNTSDTNLPSVPQLSLNYYIFKDDSDGSYKAINGITRKVDYSDTLDVGEVLNAAIGSFASSNPEKGGVIRLSTGVFKTRSTIVPRSAVTIEGGGIGTIIQLDENQNKDVVKSYDFDALVRSGTSSGVYGVTLKNLVIDGNSADNTIAGYGIRKYGYGWFLNDIIIRNCRQDGLWSQWADDSIAPSTNLSMEDYYSKVIINQNQGRGITFRGPHDSTAVQCFVWGNREDGVVIESLRGQYSGSINLISSHMYANKADGNGVLLNNGELEYSDLIVETAYQDGGVGINCNGGVIKGNSLWCFDNDIGIRLATESPCIMEDSFISKNRIGIDLVSGNHVMSGMLFDNNNRNQTAGTGLKVGSPTQKVSGNMLRFKISGSKTQEIEWSNSANDLNMLQALIYVPVGASCLTGNPNTLTNTLLIQNDGPGILFQTKDGQLAGVKYDSSVQNMINTMYSALRKRGLIT